MLESVRTLLRRAALLALVASVSLTVVPAGAFAVDVPVASERITGTVAFSGGFSQDAVVSAVAFSYDAVAKGWDAVAAADVTGGAYALDLPAAGTYRVGFFDAGLVYADRYYAAASKVESGTDIVVTPGAVAAGINDTMTALPEYIIQGKVAFVGETAPVDGVGVTVYSYNATDGANALVTRRTQADGTYRIHLPAPDPANGYTGAYRIGFTDFDDVFAPMFFNSASTVASATELVVNTPGTIRSGVDATLTAQSSKTISSSDVYGLSVKLSGERFDDGSGVPVVLASGASWRDLVVAGPLSHGLGGPLLATGPSTVPQNVLDEITRLGSTQVVIVGGPGSVNLNEEYQLREHGVSVVRRIYGNDAFTTATQVANEMVNSGIAEANNLQVAVLPYETADPSVGAGAVIDANDIPVLFTKKNVLPAATARFLARKVPTRTLVVGGTGYISSAVASKIPAREQFSASTAAGVSTKVAAFGIKAYDLADRIVGLVPADKPAQAFVADTYLASKRITAISTKASSLDIATKAYLSAQKAVIARVIAIGTPSAFRSTTTAAAFAAVK